MEYVRKDLYDERCALHDALLKRHVVLGDDYHNESHLWNLAVFELEIMRAELESIKAHILTLGSGALGRSMEVGFSYRDEMVANIDSVLTMKDKEAE